MFDHVLVCGGAGWLGSHLVEALIQLGSSECKHIHVMDVVPLDLDTISDSCRVTSHVVDLRDA